MDVELDQKLIALGFIPVLLESNDYTTGSKLNGAIGWCNELIHLLGSNKMCGKPEEWVWQYLNSKPDNTNAIFYFKDPKYATMFTLRWVD